MIFGTDDLRIAGLRPLIPPAILMEELPIGEKSSETVARGREQVQAILRGVADRLIAVVGPCSVHDPEAALDYAHRLRAAADARLKALVTWASIATVRRWDDTAVAAWRAAGSDSNARRVGP